MRKCLEWIESQSNTSVILTHPVFTWPHATPLPSPERICDSRRINGGKVLTCNLKPGPLWSETCRRWELRGLQTEWKWGSGSESDFKVIQGHPYSEAAMLTWWHISVFTGIWYLICNVAPHLCDLQRALKMKWADLWLRRCGADRWIKG